MATVDTLTDNLAPGDEKSGAMSEEDKKQGPAPTVEPGLAEEIETLKRTVSDLLAQQAHLSHDVPQGPAPDPHVLAEIERYQRMEACLYNHRKDWEVDVGPGEWNLKYEGVVWPRVPRLSRYLRLSNQTWTTCDTNLERDRQYDRPDVFDPAHICDVDAKNPIGSSIGKDAYDTTIDWGYRRDRLRKTFEWEMDRLYLREELQLKNIEQNKSNEGKKRRERRMAEADAQLGDKPMVDSTLPDAPDSVKPSVAWMEWYTFESLGRTKEKAVNTIEVLIGEPIIDNEVTTNIFWFRNSSHRVKDTKVPSTSQKAISSIEPTTSPIPERIRINSEALLSIVAELLGTEGRTLLELEDMTAVFTRPYKALAYREQEFRDWCHHLQKKFGDLSSEVEAPISTSESITGANRQIEEAEEEKQEINNNIDVEASAKPNSVPAHNTEVSEQAPHGDTTETLDNQVSNVDNENAEDDENDIEDSDHSLTKSVTAFKHLKCLLEFFDSSVSVKRDYLNGPQCRKVFFSDLWYLFRPGTEVIGSDGRQAYRVIGVTSAKHRIAPLWERWHRQSRRDKDFNITCAYIDFDGSNIGPVLKDFGFKRFDGMREVTSLEVYPLRFHPVRQSEYSALDWKEMEIYPATERYRRKLMQRGAKFLDVARGKHMYYAGSTLDEKEQVESPVVVDFETAFVMHDTSRKAGDEDTEDKSQSSKRRWKPNLSTLLGMADGEPSTGDASCSGDCCRNDFVYDDQHVDRRQRNEYIESLLPKANALDEQPPITIMPRPLKDIQTGSEGNFTCSDDELVIMSYRVFGFVLRSRKFAKLDLTYVTEFHAPEELSVKTKTPKKDGSNDGEAQAGPTSPFDRLVLEEGHSSMIVSLIAQHFRDKKATTGQREEFDIVKGKGKGLIILLHGAPGVGKTSTAEGVAEKFKKPLFQITCGDLGTTAAEVELALEKNFSLANKWDCILLLDEADVFLTERSKEDFKRNGLVAVFLRLMEYYSGILFLTTNRVGDFDEAFTSRIHVSLYYPALNQDKTVKVFKINLDMIEDRFKKKGRVINIERMEIGGFATQYFTEHKEARWNGRQIRNACQTALALAEFEAQGSSLQETEDRDLIVNLTVKHFEIVRNAYLEFTKYMQNLYGTSDTRRAKESRLRAIVVDDNDNIIATQNMDGTKFDKKAAFRLASRNHPGHPTGHSPQQSIYNPPDQQYGRYQQQSSNFGAHQPQHHSNYQPPQQTPPNQSWNSQQSRNSGALNPEPQRDGQFRGSTQRTPQVPPSPNQQPQTHANQPLLDDNIRSMYAASGQPYEETSAGASGSNRGPIWNCPSCGFSHSGPFTGFCSACGWKEQWS